MGLSQISQPRTSNTPPPPSVYAPPSVYTPSSTGQIQATPEKSPTKTFGGKSYNSFDDFYNAMHDGPDPGGAMRASYQKMWDQTPATQQAYDNAPGMNAAEDARDQTELSNQQKARQKVLSGRATDMLSSFQTAQTSRPNLASRMLMGV